MARPSFRLLNGLNLAVIGAGYVGLVTAACLVRLGHRVTLVEINPERVATLQAGRVPIHEAGLQELLTEGLGSGRLTVTDDPAAGMRGRDAILLCVGTPLSEEGEADLRQLRGASAAVAEHGIGATVVVRSTLPLGASEQLATWLGRDDLLDVVTNPEFLRQGTAVADFLSPTRIVIGTRDGRASRASRLVERIYRGLEAPIVVTDFASADMIKNAANAFLATKLSFVNEIADLCEAYGADVEDVIEGIGLDPRIGRTYLRPGIGFGGSCLPKELTNLMRLGRRRRLPVHLLHAASNENGGRAVRIVDRIDGIIDGIAGRRVALLGLSFKPGTDDLRYSPAIALARALLQRGASVVAHDPVVPADRTAHVAGLMRADDIAEACAGADVVILATEWPEYCEMGWATLRSVVARAFIFDGRNALDADALRAQGWDVAQVGRPFTSALREPATGVPETRLPVTGYTPKPAVGM